MPAPYPEEFRARAVSLVLDEGLPAAQVARDLGIAESGLLASPFQELGDIECAAEYIGCVGRKLRFW